MTDKELEQLTKLKDKWYELLVDVAGKVEIAESYGDGSAAQTYQVVGRDMLKLYKELETIISKKGGE